MELSVANRGRPYGGLAWIIREGIKHSVQFITDRISVCSINGLDIIGAYMTANGNSTSVAQHEINVTELERLVSRLTENDKKLIAIGDFNSDPRRKSSFDMLLVNASRNMRAKFICEAFKGELDFTFFGPTGQSNIDHVITFEKYEPEVLKIELVDHANNSSDHIAIKAVIKNSTDEKANTPVTKASEKGKRPTWRDLRFKNTYKELLERELVKQTIEGGLLGKFDEGDDQTKSRLDNGCNK